MKITRYDPKESVDHSYCVKKNKVRVAAYCRVSTDNEEQLNSYNSMIDYYTNLINSNADWQLQKIYADEGITGTKTKDRVAFSAMISDALGGNIDLIITKSIARFARNTVDTLNYVRVLKNKGIAVIFENENINTMSMDGELLLTILASVAQQEVENISANVKKGLYAKMSRGELVGFNRCLGYDYDPDTKTISINQQEANIVHYIFDQYTNGKGGVQISRELNELGYRSKLGNQWSNSTIIGIIKNEKYVGDLKQGKTYTVDPISKRRIKNNNESVYYVAENHHEPIISREQFDKCQEILKKRSYNRSNQRREKYSRAYAFSCMLKCAYCGSSYSRRAWHSGSNYHKVVWQCSGNTKKGKDFCPNAKGIPEKVIEDAFVKSYNLFCGDNKEALEEFLQNVRKAIGKNEIDIKIHKLDSSLKENLRDSERLLDLYLAEKLDKSIYEKRYQKLEEKRKILEKKREQLNIQTSEENTLEERIKELRENLKNREILSEFSREVFECIVEKVIIGGYGEDGTPNPYDITFIYKTGFSDKVNAEIKKKCSNNGVAQNKCVPKEDTTHVETVCLLSNRKPDSYVHLNLKMEDYYRIKDAQKEQDKK